MVLLERALILIKTKSPSNTELYKKLKAYPKVVEVNLIYGPYDIYALCEDTTTMGIKRTVIDIRNMSSVVSTLTCLISE